MALLLYPQIITVITSDVIRTDQISNYQSHLLILVLVSFLLVAHILEWLCQAMIGFNILRRRRIMRKDWNVELS